MTEFDDVRQQIGIDAVESMDQMSNEVLEAVSEYVPHLYEMAQAISAWDMHDRINYLVGMAIAAALND